MLLVNSKILQKDLQRGHELYEYSKEYEIGLRDLQTRFSDGIITLRRNGYPKVNKRVDGTVTLPEDAPPIMIPLTETDDKGVVWSYVQGRPKIGANGLVEPEEGRNRTMLNGEVIQLSLRKDPDYAFYIWFKSRIVGVEYHVEDIEGDAIKEAKAKQERKRVESLIWNDFDDNKEKLMCEAYGLSITAKGKEIDVALLRQKLEDKVFAMEAEKQRDKTNLMAKGVAAFLADAKADEFTRPKAIIQRAIDEKIISYRGGKYNMGDIEICLVPFDRQSKGLQQEYLAEYFRTKDDGEKWGALLKAVVDKDYIDSLDKYGIWWLADQVGVRRNQQVPAIKQQVYEKFGISVEVPEGTAD